MPSTPRNCNTRQTRYVVILRAIAVAVILCVPAVAIAADSRAYVVAPGFFYDTPGSITPFYPKKSVLGAAYFVPTGDHIVVAPGTKQIWETVSKADSGGPPWSIDVLDPKSGSMLATIPLSSSVASLVLDAAGQYAYVSTNSGALLKIDVASRSIVQTASLGNDVSGSMALSGDGSKLFLGTGTAVLVVQLPSLKTIASIPFAGSPFISGSTLLVADNDVLLYFDATTLQQTNSATVPPESFVFGVSPDVSRVYLSSNGTNGVANTMEVLDFSSGQTLASQSFPNADLTNLLLSPDGTYILVPSSPILIIDPKTLVTLKTVASVGIPNSAVYLDSDTVLILNKYTDAMVVIDQSSAAVTASFPLGLNLYAGEVADPRRSVVYVGGDSTNDGTPNVVSAKLNRIVENLPIIGFAPAAVSGDQLYGFLNGAVEFYNLATGRSGSLPPPVIVDNYYDAFGTAAIPPDGKTLWAPFEVLPVCCIGCCFSLPQSSASTTPAGLAIYSAATNGLLSLTGLPNGIAPISSIVFRRDSSRAYLAGNAVIAVYSAHTFKALGAFNYTTTFSSLAISPDGSVLYAYDGKAVYVLDAGTGVQKQVFALPSQGPYGPTAPIALSPDGTTIFVTDYAGSAVDLIRTATGEVIQVAVPYLPGSVVVLPSN